MSFQFFGTGQLGQQTAIFYQPWSKICSMRYLKRQHFSSRQASLPHLQLALSEKYQPPASGQLKSIPVLEQKNTALAMAELHKICFKTAKCSLSSMAEYVDLQEIGLKYKHFSTPPRWGPLNYLLKSASQWTGHALFHAPCLAHHLSPFLVQKKPCTMVLLIKINMILKKRLSHQKTFIFIS